MATERFKVSIDLNRNQLLNPVGHTLASAPGTPVEAQFWYNSSVKKWQYYDGSGVATFGVDTGGNADTLDNQLPAYYLARANHTGTQAASTISDFDTEVSNNTDVASNTAFRHDALNLDVANGLSLLGQELSLSLATTSVAGAMSSSDKSKLDGIEAGAEVNTVTSVALKTGDVALVIADIGGLQTALDGKSAVGHEHAGEDITSGTIAAARLPDLSGTYATPSYVTTQIDNLVDSAPGTLDTLNELAAALGDDPNFATTVTNGLNAKPDKYAAAVPSGSTTATITHNLNSTDVFISVKEVSDSTLIRCEMVVTDANTVTLKFNVAPTSNQYRVTVIG